MAGLTCWPVGWHGLRGYAAWWCWAGRLALLRDLGVGRGKLTLKRLQLLVEREPVRLQLVELVRQHPGPLVLPLFAVGLAWQRDGEPEMNMGRWSLAMEQHSDPRIQTSAVHGILPDPEVSAMGIRYG